MLYCWNLIDQLINSSYIGSYFSYFFSSSPVLISKTYSISFILLSADSFDYAICLIISSFYCSYFIFEFWAWGWSFTWGFFEPEFWFTFYFLRYFDLFSFLYWATAETIWLGYFFFSILSKIYVFSFLTICPEPLYDFGTTFLSAKLKSTWADPLFSSAL